MLYDITTHRLQEGLQTTVSQTTAIATRIAKGYSPLHRAVPLDESLAKTLKLTTEHHALVNGIHYKFELLNLAIQGVKDQ